MRKRISTALADRSRLREEDGFAVPFVAMLLVGISAVVAVGVVATVRAQSGTARDQNSKEAIAIAEAGVNQALLHYNRIPTTGTNLCLVNVSGTTVPAPVQLTGTQAGWCQAVSGGIPGGTFTYSVKPTPGALEIVSTGTAGAVTRRVEVVAQASSGQQVFADFTVLSQNGITMDSNAEIAADAATNGNITLSSNARVCGVASHGVGRDLTLIGNAHHYGRNDLGCDPTTSGVEAEEPLYLPPVNQGDTPTNNDNGRFFTRDVLSGDPTSWTVASRRMRLRSNSTLTLGGSVYSFCRLELDSNANLFIAEGAQVTIFFDAPENCSLAPGEAQLDLASNSVIAASGEGPINLAMLFVGSDTIPTHIQLNSNTQANEVCEQNFIVYAPRTDIDVDSNARYCGAIAAKTLHLDSNAQVYTDSLSSSFAVPSTIAHYEIGSFIECNGAATGAPDTGC